jgi:hypothetical protein
MKGPRKTHPASPLYFPPQTESDGEQQAQISVDFSQLTGQASDAQVPESAVTQHEAALDLSFTQMTDNPTAPQKADILASAALTGTPTAPTAGQAPTPRSVATTAFVTALLRWRRRTISRRRERNYRVSGEQRHENGVIALGKSSLVMQIHSVVKCRIRSVLDGRVPHSRRIASPGIDPTGETRRHARHQSARRQPDVGPVAALARYERRWTPVSNIYYAIQNLSGASQAVTVTLTRILLEA